MGITDEIRDYDEEYQGMTLLDNEYLLKIRSDNTGFMSKLTKKEELPKAFDSWNEHTWSSVIDLPIKVIEEDYRKGWKIDIGSRYDMYRIGKSQQWVKLTHPLGFKLEIYLESFFTDVLPYMQNGVILGEWKWVGNKIEKK